MKTFKKIVVGINFSDKDLDVIHYVGAIANLSKAEKICFTHIVPIVHVSKKLQEEIKTINELEKKKMEEIVHANLSVYPGTSLEFIVKEGNVIDEMLKITNDEDADLLILGRREKEISHRKTVEKLAAMALCSVFVIPNKSKMDIHSILVPLDFSEYSVKALNKAVSLATIVDVEEITTIHVYDVKTNYATTAYGSFYEPVVPAIEISVLAEQELENAKKRFDDFIKQCDLKNIKVSPLFKFSEIESDAISEVISEKTPDILVMGAKGHTSAVTTLMGSTVENVIWVSNVPVLVIKKKGENYTFFKAIFGKD